jgi:3-deoxy-D-manno-octulosonate 8-phosphate phosphatase (KDO 8-P phosphatase)
MNPPSQAPADLLEICGLAMDVDGVLTDGGVWWGPDGEEWKRVSFADIMGLSLARRAGIIPALISGENSPFVDHIAKKLLIRHVIKGCRDKAAALRQFSSESGLSLAEICYVGDDINDLPAMEIAGYSVAPPNAAAEVLARASLITRATGGNGAVREIVNALLAARGITQLEAFRRE